MTNDAELVAAALTGDPEAFAPIIERYQDAVFAIALARLGRFHDAQDVTQEVFLEAFKGLERLRDPSRLGSWLRTIAINRSVDNLRRRRDMASIEHVEGDAAAIDDHVKPERNELREQVLAAIGKLGGTHRETVTLFYINGYSVAEIAEMQQAPAGTVKGRLHDARKKLEKEMMKTVEIVLKAEAPKKDFGAQVLGLIYLAGWGGFMDEARAQNDTSVSGVVDALSTSASSATRVFAARLLRASKHGSEGVIRQLIEALTDSNKKVRKFAVTALLSAQHESIADERRRREFVPKAAELLQDRSWQVRDAAARVLRPFAEHISWDVVASALVRECEEGGVGQPATNASARKALLNLLKAVVEAHKETLR